MSLWTTARVAEEVGFSEDWVRQHAAELGGIRTGISKHSRLRFEPEDIAAWKKRRRLSSPIATQTPQRRGRAVAPAGVALLPLPSRR